MARRYNTKKIAKQPLLKKRMAKFCAQVDIEFTKPDYVEILAHGHRGFISYAEDSLAKEFDKRLMLLRTKYNELKAKEEDGYKGEKPKWYRESIGLNRIKVCYEEGVSIANEIFEEQFLG